MTGSGPSGAWQAPDRRAVAPERRGARWRRSVTVLIGAVVAGLVSLVVQGTSHACSCMPYSPAEQIEISDAVFVGTPISQVDTAGGEGGGLRWSFDVETVHKGEVGATTSLETAGDSAACGIEFREGERYLVFATGQDRIGANLCSGTGPVDRADAETLALLGEGSPPTPDRATADTDEGVSWPLVGGITAVVLIGGAVVLLLMRARRRA